MSYTERKAQFYRQPVQIIELYLQRCANVYGDAATGGNCTAAVGVTGLRECFQVLGSGQGNGETDGGCQDSINFAPDESKPYVFATRRIDDYEVSAGAGSASFVGPVFPILQNVDTSPTKLDIGKGLGTRASVSCQLQDVKYTDIGIDPYAETNEPLEIMERGTLLGRMLRRHRYYQGRRADVLTGYLNDDGSFDAANFVRRTYVIEEIKMPNAKGQASITLKDPLKKADPERAQFPKVSFGTLLLDMTETAVGAADTITLNAGQAAAYTDAEYVRIDDEIMQVVSVDTGADTISVLRATLPSWYRVPKETAGHEAGSTVQQLALYNGTRIDSVVYDLLRNGAGIPDQFFPSGGVAATKTPPTAWRDIADVWFPDYLLHRLIVEVTAVKDLVTELTEHGVLLWWDERRQEIRFDALNPLEQNAAPTWDDDTHLLDASIEAKIDSKTRISESWVYYGQRDPLESTDERKNYAAINIDADLDAESAQEYGDTRINVVFSAWLKNGQKPVADEIGTRLLLEYRDPKRIVGCKVDAKDDDVWTGDSVFIKSQFVQDDFGNPQAFKYRILQVKEVWNQGKVEYVHTLQSFPELFSRGKCAIFSPDEDLETAPDAFPDYVDASIAERIYAFFGSDADNTMPNGDVGYIFC